MPVENERKFVLSDLKTKDFETEDWVHKEIWQGYLKDGGRIREYNSEGNVSHLFTYKVMVDEELIEIETTITEHDFNALRTVCTKWFNKTRYTERHPDENMWEIDFFGDKQNSYFVMAECEIFNGADKPVRYPGILEDRIIYMPERADKRFTSKSLTNEEKAATLYSMLRKEFLRIG